MIDRVVRPAAGQPAEPSPQAGPIVVIAGQRQEGQSESVEDRLQLVVLGVGAVVHQVAGAEHEVDPVAERVDELDGPPQARRGVDAVGHRAAGFDDVAVGDLCDQHGRGVNDRSRRS